MDALISEADLTPKPGLVDRRGSGSHGDMDRRLLHASAQALWPAFAQCAAAAQSSTSDTELRMTLGRIGRDGERAMLVSTGGVNTHRGALWALGLLSAAVQDSSDITGIVTRAAQLAQIPDPAKDTGHEPESSHGAEARRRYHVGGAAGEAQAGFPHVTRHALPALARARSEGCDEPTARLQALLSLMAHLDDTCVLHRGGQDGLHLVQNGALAVLQAGGPKTRDGRRLFADLDRACALHRLSPGGSGDLLSAALFLEYIQGQWDNTCRH